MLRQRVHSAVSEEYSEQETSHLQQLMPSIMEGWSSPKFITCPDCGERYDNDRKRRLIDTCGHPRCYSCLFVDKPCPLCLKIPQARPRANTELHEPSDGSVDKNSQLKQPGKLNKDQYKGSHPNLNEIHKARSATLPHPGFRADNYLRSLYRYDPHGSQDHLLSSLNVKPRIHGVPNYHKSLENLTEQFWQSVERAGGTRSTSPTHSSGDDTSSNEGTRLVVPARPRSQTEFKSPSEYLKEENRRSLPLKNETLRRLGVETSELSRPRSNSDLSPNVRSVENSCLKGKVESHHRERVGEERPRSFSPTQLTYQGSPHGSDSDRTRPQSVSDRSSDISMPFSDSWSESSGDSDQATPLSPPPVNLPRQWSFDENQNERCQRNGELSSTPEVHSEQGTRSKKITKNPLEGVIHWVIDPPKKSQGYQFIKGELEDARKPAPPTRASSIRTNSQLVNVPGSQHKQTWPNGQVKSAKVTTL